MLKIEKTVKVSDAYRWYRRKEIDVVMWHPDHWDNTDEMKNAVRIMFALKIPVVLTDFTTNMKSRKG